jgi:hypothetical protein
MPVQEAFSAGKLSLVEAARLVGLPRETQQELAEAFAQGQDVTELLRKQLATAIGRRKGKIDDAAIVSAQVSALRRWLDSSRHLVDVTDDLTKDDRQILMQAQTVIRTILGQKKGQRLAKKSADE